MSTPATPLLTSHLGRTYLTRAWIFQAIIASPILLVLGFLCFVTVYDGSSGIYDFILYLGNTILAAAVIFIILIQHKLQPELFLRTMAGRRLGYYFEVIKSVLATGLWLWILLDAIFHPCRYDYYSCPEFYRRRRVICCGIAYILLVLFWYPAVIYSGYVVHHPPPEEEGVERQHTEEGEEAPLLGNESV